MYRLQASFFGLLTVAFAITGHAASRTSDLDAWFARDLAPYVRQTTHHAPEIPQ